jgi:glycosyltransferase involved in cell wall biosynthesis
LEITIVGPSPEERQGGGVRTRTLVDVLESAGARVSGVYHSFHTSKFRIRLQNRGNASQWVSINFPNYWPRPLKAVSLIFILAYAWRLSKRSDLILCTFGSILFAMPAIIVSKVRGKPIALDYIDTELYGVPESVCKYFLRKADLVFAISHYLADKAESYGCENVVYLPTFVNIEFFQMDVEAREKIRRKLGYRENDVVIGYAGSLAPFEGIPVLVQAFEALTRKYANVRLAIVGRRLLGTDCDIPQLSKGVGLEDKIALIPPVPRVEYPKLLSAFDILCVPRTDCLMSRAASPIKVTEYLSMGLPTVCSSIGEMSIIIRHKVNGFLAKPSDADDLASTLEEILLNPEYARKVGSNGRKEVIEKYSFTIIGDEISRSLAKIVKRDGSANCKG